MRKFGGQERTRNSEESIQSCGVTASRRLWCSNSAQILSAVLLSEAKTNYYEDTFSGKKEPSLENRSGKSMTRKGDFGGCWGVANWQ